VEVFNTRYAIFILYIASPSAGEREGFPIAAPVTWKQVEKGMEPDALFADETAPALISAKMVSDA
jgi:DNA primase